MEKHEYTKMLADIDTARAILEPYELELSAAMHKGFQRYMELPGEARKTLRLRTKAGIIHDLQVEELEILAEKHEGLKAKMFGELFLLYIGDKFAVKVKKFDKKLKSRSQPTEQVKAFLSQKLELPGMESPTNLELGYTLTSIGNLQEVFITCPNGRHKNYWSFDLDTGVEHVCEVLPFDQQEEPTRKLFTGKGKADEQFNEQSSKGDNK